MKQAVPIWLTGLLLSVLGLATLWWWLGTDPAAHLRASVPGQDGRRAGAGTAKTVVVKIGESFRRFDGVASDLPGDWPCFRGPNGDNISPENVKLADAWPPAGPPVLWSVDLGEGHAGPAVHQGCVYLLDYVEAARHDALRCFSLADGKEIWRRSYRVTVKRNHGLSRTVPAVTDKYVVTMGPRCHVMCVDTATGDFRWGLDLVKDWGTTEPLWYTAQCPLIDNGIAVIAPGGTSALLAGIDCASGKTVWQTPNPRNWKMSHSSVAPAVIAGRRMYVYCAVGGIVGVSAEAADRGALLWESTLWSPAVIAPVPVVLPGDRIFVTAGYSAGAMLLQVTKAADGSFAVTAVGSKFRPTEGLASEQQTPLLWHGHLFAVLPKDAGANRDQFVCALPPDCRRLVWTSGKTHRFGLGPYLVADGKILLLNDEGTLFLLRASVKEYQELARATVIPGGIDAWAPMALAGGRLLLRDSRRLVCLDLTR